MLKLARDLIAQGAAAPAPPRSTAAAEAASSLGPVEASVGPIDSQRPAPSWSAVTDRLIRRLDATESSESATMPSPLPSALSTPSR